MTVMQPSKGGNDLAQSFMTNTATQAPQALPQIQAPQSLLPMGPMAMPKPQGPMFSAQFAPQTAPVSPFLSIFGRGPAQGPQAPWYEASNAIDKAPTSQAGIFGV